MHKPAHDTGVFGFWVYLMSDCVLFASLFAAYAVLRNNTFGGPAGKDIFDLEFVLIESLILLTSSFTVGLAMLAVRRQAVNAVLSWLLVTLFLGLAFLGMEIWEFHHLIANGEGPQRSAFLSAFFTLIGTHGAHIAAGSIALVVLIARVWRQGISEKTAERLTNLSLFWHFLDIVWIFIFTVVYLMGVAV